MKAFLLGFAFAGAVLFAACVPAKGFEGYFLGTFPADGYEWHRCPKSLGGGACREGYACVPNACRPCFSNDGPTQCTEANDEYP